jgi:DNA-binding NarL/FixJ family response regulator
VQYSATRGASRKPVAVLVGIIEPQALFAPFLTRLFADAGFSVVASLESMELDELRRKEPTVVFVDIDFVEFEAVTALRQLRGAVPNATICAYTARTDEGWGGVCSRAGANCVLSKSTTPSEIVAGIRHALRVGTFVDPRFDNRDREPSDEDTSNGLG